MGKNFGWRVSPIADGELSFRYNYFDDIGFEYDAYVFVKASKDNKRIIVYINQKDFASFTHGMFDYVEEDLMTLLQDYINSAIEDMEIEKSQ